MRLPLTRTAVTVAVAALSGCADSTAPPPSSSPAPPAASLRMLVVPTRSVAWVVVRDLELRVTAGLDDPKVAETLRTDLSSLADAIDDGDARRTERLVARVRQRLADYSLSAGPADAPDRDAIAYTLDTLFPR